MKLDEVTELVTAFLAQGASQQVLRDCAALRATLQDIEREASNTELEAVKLQIRMRDQMKALGLEEK